MALTPEIRHTQAFVEVLVKTDPPLLVTQVLVEVLMNATPPPPPAGFAGELDRRTLTSATGAVNATWTGTAVGAWTAGVVALKKT
jgi:hypothetical protein